MSRIICNFAIANKMVVDYSDGRRLSLNEFGRFSCPYYIRILRCHCVRLSLSGSIILLAAQMTPLLCL